MLGGSDTRGRLNAIDPIDAAIQYTRLVLFEPFLYTKWLNFGVIIFLSMLFEVIWGISQSVSFNVSSPVTTLIAQDPEATYERVEQFVITNFGAMVAMAFPVLLLLLLVGAGFMYIGARGGMMLIRAVATNDESIGANWEAVGKPAWTYFVLKFEILVVWILYLFVSVAIIFVLIRNMAYAGEVNGGAVAGIVAVIVFGILAWILFALINFVMHNFIAPLIYHFGVSAGEAFGEFLDILRGNFGHLLLLMLIKIVYSFVLSIAAVFAVYCTCCLGAIPVLGQAILAPFYVFERSYSLKVFGTLGPEYMIIREPEFPVPPVPPNVAPPPAPDINQ